MFHDSELDLASDTEVARRILAHIDFGTTDEGESWREPVSNYLDPGRFNDEMAMLRRGQSVFAPSAAVPGDGDHVERTVFGTPLFAVRGRDELVRVFRNACRHRGATLVDSPGCFRTLVCPYHGWTYRLDGSLLNVPHSTGFPDLDASTRGLVELACREIDGLIVIDAVDSSTSLSDQGSPGHFDGRAWRDVPLGASGLDGVSSRVAAINWKVMVEQFLEGYHIRSTHRETFYPLQYDNLNVVELFGPNSRVAYPYRNIERLHGRAESTWTLNHRVTFVYQLFPNVMIATFPDRILVIAVDPIDVGHSTVTVYTMRRDEKPDPSALGSSTGSDTAATGRSLVDRGAVEDNAMSEAVQQGLRSGANTFIEFGRHESAIGHFHRSLDERLDAFVEPSHGSLVVM